MLFISVVILCRLLTNPLQASDTTRTIYVIHESWHTGIIIRSADLQEPLRKIISEVAGYPYIEFGWGEAEYFQSSDPTIGMALRAVLWPTPSVMQVYGFTRHPMERSGAKAIVALSLNMDGLERLSRAIAASFELDSLHRSIKTSDWGPVVFYKAKESYHLFNMCNHWTARMLQEAGLPISDIGAFTAETVMQRLEGIGQRIHKK